jgi:hypothetical protein
MFNWPLRFLMEAYLEICFGSWMKYLKEDLTFGSKTDAMDSVLAWFYLIIGSLCPFLLLLIITFWKPAITSKGAFYTRLEELFADIKMTNRYTMNWVTVFFFRRLSLVMTIFFSDGDKAIF